MIKILNDNTNYWLVRTAGGAYYDQFVAENFIAVGWNKISNLDLIKEAKADEEKRETMLKEIRKLVDTETEKETQPKGEREREAQKSRIFNQINRFVNEMSIGDYVLIPSSHSNLIEFGIIISDAKIVKKEVVDMEEDECDFTKRRDVEWLYRAKRDKLDPYLYGLIYSQHAISSANDYAHYIDRTINRFFVKGNQAHLIFEVDKKSEIYGGEFIKFINVTLNLLDSFNEFTESNLDKDLVQIKANVQSPGFIEFFGNINIIFAISLMITAIIGGKFSLFKIATFESLGIIEQVRKFIEQFQRYNIEKEKLSLQKSMQSLQIKIPPELQEANQDISIEENKD